MVNRWGVVLRDSAGEGRELCQHGRFSAVETPCKVSYAEGVLSTVMMTLQEDAMRTIDIHAHLMPQCLWKTVDAGQTWHGSRYEPGAGLGAVVRDGKRIAIQSPKLRFTPEERLQDMDAQGVDVQVISIHTPLFGYDLDLAEGRQLAREVNDEIADMTRQWPARFAGLATLPVQDVGAAVAELERAVNTLGLKGAELDTVMQGHTWDEPQFLPLFKAAEALGAVLFFHPQPQDNLLLARTGKYGLANSIGVPVEDALVSGRSHLWRDSRRVSRAQGMHCPRGRASLLRHGPYGSGLAGAL